MASNGYIVCIPDYTGFGASEDIMHPYYHKASSNSAVIDMLHALGEMARKTDILPSQSGHYYLMGYSQGGWATLAAMEEIEKDDSTGITLWQLTVQSCDLITMSAMY
jgi:dienelactone hydrolase